MTLRRMRTVATVCVLAWPVAGLAQERAAAEPSGVADSQADVAGERDQSGRPARAQERNRRLRALARERREARSGAEATARVTRAIDIGRQGAVEIENVSGRISVTGTQGPTVRLEAVKRVWHRNDADAKALLEQLDVRIVDSDGRVTVRTVYPRQASFDAEVDYTVSVPQDASVTLRSASGDVNVSNIKGDLRVSAVSGAVTARNVGTIRLIRSVSGGVSVDGANGEEVVVSTMSGAIAIRRAGPRVLDARSVSGAVRVAESESDRVSMRTLSGAVEYAGRVARGGRYDLQSRSGRVVASPSGGDGFDVEAETFRGDFRSEFPLTLRERAGGRRAVERERVVRGTFGDGGGLLTLRTGTGDIAIAKP